MAGPYTPDRHPGPADEEELILEDRGVGATPSEAGGMIRAAGALTARAQVTFQRVIGDNVNVPEDGVLIHHDPEIDDGVDVVVEDGGEIVLL